MAADELEKLRREFSELTPEERADIARAMLEGAVKYARRKKKAAM
jgi:hypothetical protein